MAGLLSLLLFAGFFYLMMRFGFGAHMVHGINRGHVEQSVERETKHIDPVCGMEVAATRGYAKMHKGKLYRFCSRTCLDQFETKPERFLKASHDVLGGDP